ncbi:MAG: AmmeMemoRadiSam system radical SAM enzyme [Oscillospiraceae bacterium]|nr:AmmeMemoRadiSam system radical SAM enzyme [Oscillospiraceae bacterium]
MICEICPRHCDLAPGQTGFCRARTNIENKIICSNYGRITSLALDPIEKKPLSGFFPGKRILSVGSFGCNLRCPFCQNHEISMAGDEAQSVYMPPKTLLERASELVPQGNIGVAFTYNEPLISYEYLLDCAKLLKSQGLKVVLVTNGMICKEPLKRLLPYVDAMNIDLKGFTQEYYNFVGGDLGVVLETIELAAKSCHVEISTLIITGKNDSENEMRALSSWLASVDPEIPLHLQRFFPRYKMQDSYPTDTETMRRLRGIAAERLKYVYADNC